MTDRRRRVVAFGELMMRLNPIGTERFAQADRFEVRYTGAEANAAVLLSGLGHRTDLVSRVPESDLGQACINFFRRFGVGTDHVARGGERLGIFFIEAGAAQRPSKVIYDRGQSAFRDMRSGDLDWDGILADADWLHFSGTAPASGAGVRTILTEGLAVAKRRGVTVSCDLNYRAKLWSPKEAEAAMRELMTFVDVLIGNEEDAERVFGVKAGRSRITQGEIDVASHQEVAARLVSMFGVRYVATTLRTSRSASDNRWMGMLFDGTTHFQSRSYDIVPVVDRVGGGDAFAGGLIHGLLEGLDGQRCVEFATAASCLKHSIPGDFGLLSLAEIETLLAGDASGRVQR